MTKIESNTEQENTSSNHTKLSRFLWPIIFLALIGSVTYAYLKPTVMTPAQRAISLESQVKCPACEGQSVENSTAAIAVSIKAKIYQDVLKNESDSQILNSLAATYGQDIYLSPHGSSYADLSWIIPTVLIFLIVIFLSGTLLNRKYNFISFVKKKDLQGSESKSKALHSKKLLYIGLSLITIGILYFLGLALGLNLPGKRNTGSQFSQTQLLEIANFQASVGDTAGAITTYKEVLTENSSNTEALTEEGWLISQNGTKTHNKNYVALGQALIEKALSYRNDNAQAHLYLGTIYLLDLHQPTLAADQYKIFLGLNPPQNLIAVSKPEIIQAFASIGEPIPSSLRIRRLPK